MSAIICAFRSTCNDIKLISQEKQTHWKFGVKLQIQRFVVLRTEQAKQGFDKYHLIK